ncbi:unannotated protein [freshwater metagenome]|uniref:Unannotated protein n=1 Tax=freshwater metagenome TaxID=449393 RepID=A0A6J7PFY7_9ZZZZ
MMSGAISTSPMSPTARYESVSVATWKGSATYVIIDPRYVITPLKKRSR